MTPPQVDIARNRAAPRYSRRENLQRVLWALAQPLFRLSPRPCFWWRAFLLRAFGADIGRHVHIYPSTRITLPWNLAVGDWSSLGEDVLIYNLGRVTVGAHATVSLRAFLCAGTHDYNDPAFPLLKSPIIVADDAWICAGAYVGPGVVVGRGAVIAAQAVATKDIEAWSIHAGNPSRLVGRRQVGASGNR